MKSAMAPVKVLIGTAILNEGEKFKKLSAKLDRFVKEMSSENLEFVVFVVDDGSDDGVYDELKDVYPFVWVRHLENLGAGVAVRKIYNAAREMGCKAAVTIAGNGKDNPDQIPRLLDPVLKGDYDFIQGSRYLPQGGHRGMPAYRFLATRYLHPWLMSLFTGHRITDSTNGFRALDLRVLDDPGIDLGQEWLDRYELEPYLFYKTIALGYKVGEAPVDKFYPSKEEGYTKMKPLSGWWSILRPLVYLRLGIRS